MVETYELASGGRTYNVRADMCRFGLQIRNEVGGERPVLMPAGLPTNSVSMMRGLGKRCLGYHVHVQLLGGKAEAAAGVP